ncbi:MAG: O-antigen ligase family protein [Bacteroidota bacterium]
MHKQGMFEELLIGYFFVLILSDSLEDHLLFAKNLKNVYISVLAIFFFLDTNSFYPLNRLYKTYLLFFLFSIFTLTFSLKEPFILVAIEKTISYIISFLIVPNLITKLYREEGVEFFRRIVYFIFNTLLVGFVLKVVANNIASLDSGRFRGVFGNPNGLGMFVFLFFIAYYVLNDFYPKLFSKTENIMIYGSMLLSIYLTQSRNALLGILIFYIFQRFFNLSPLLGFMLFVIVLFVSEVISNNLTSIIIKLGLGGFFRVKTLDNGSGRYIAWAFAWKQIQLNFFIGKGFSYNEYYMRLHYAQLNKMGHQGGIHNSFLTFWMDQGLIGLIIYLRSYIIMFIKAAKKTRFSFPIMFAISFTAFFESWLVGSLSAFAFLGLFIFTLITSDEIIAMNTDEETEPTNYMVTQNVD